MGTAVRVVADGLAFPEGPTVTPDGSVVVSEMAAGLLTRPTQEGPGTARRALAVRLQSRRVRRFPSPSA